MNTPNNTVATGTKQNAYAFSIKKEKSDFPKLKITSSTDSVAYIRQFYGDDVAVYESFFLLLLNRSNHTIGYAKISQGGIAGTVVDPIIIAKYAIDTLSTAVILAHNHPSGNTTPSKADIDMTDRIKKCLILFDVKVLDHIILTEEGFYSFADNGDLF